MPPSDRPFQNEMSVSNPRTYGAGVLHPNASSQSSPRILASAASALPLMVPYSWSIIRRWRSPPPSEVEMDTPLHFGASTPDLSRRWLAPRSRFCDNGALEHPWLVRLLALGEGLPGEGRCPYVIRLRACCSRDLWVMSSEES
jgi:hypothetical protein